jgi:hypothetical protein
MLRALEAHRANKRASEARIERREEQTKLEEERLKEEMRAERLDEPRKRQRRLERLEEQRLDEERRQASRRAAYSRLDEPRKRQRLEEERRADEQRRLEERLEEQRLEEERRQANAKVGSLYDGARYLTTNTRRAAYSSNLFNPRKRRSNSLKEILSLYAESNMLSIGDPVSGRVPALQDNIEAVGAVLFDENGAYSGVAVPIVEGESHTTMIIETGTGHSSHVLITATEKQAAIALRGCMQTTNDPVITDESLTRSIKRIRYNRFLEHMFLDDVLAVGGSVPQDAAICFKEFLQSLRGINERTRSVLSAYVMHSETSETLGFIADATSDIESLLESSIASQKRNISIATEELTTSIVPMGYYDGSKKSGHQFALLVHEQQGRTIVAVSDTGETALRYRDANTIAIVAMGHTDLATGRGILDLGMRMTGVIKNAGMLYLVRMKMLERCGVSFTFSSFLSGSDTNSPPVLNDDRHLAVRFLSSGKNRIISHAQRGETCTFYSTLWLVGIADALIERPDVADHILIGSTKTASDNNAYIFDRICHIDKEMKRLALGGLIVPAHALTAELVATDYAGCVWLNTKWLRDKLTELSNQAKVDDAVLHTKCIVTKVPNTTPLLRKTGAFTLRELAEWTREHGYVGGQGPNVGNLRASAYTTFLYIARDLLIKPVTGHLVLSSDDEMDVLAISRYLSFLRFSPSTDLNAAEADSHMADTITGMAMRCVRYIAMIVKRNKKHIQPPQSESESSVVVLPARYQTSLPWVASEYYSLQEETKAIVSLLFDYRNIDSLRTKIEHEEQPKPSEVRLISTNEFHGALIAKNIQSIKDEKARVAQLTKELEDLKGPYTGHQKLPGSLVDKQNDISDIESRIAKAQAYVDNTKSLELSPEQLDALRYIQCNRDLAVLNVCTALLVHEKAPVRSAQFGTFIFGTKTEGSTRFCASTHQDASKYERMSVYETTTLYVAPALRPILNANFGLLREQEIELPPHADLFQNMEFLFDATRTCSSRKRHAHKNENEPLRLKLTYPPQRAHLDVASLVRWVDHTNAGVASCAHDDRSLEYVIRKFTMPISANGPLVTEESIRKLSTLLDAARNRASDTTVKMIGHIRGLMDRSVPTKLDVPASPLDVLLVRAYMTLAVHTGQMEKVMRVNFDSATFTETVPDSSWALTPLRADRSDKDTEVEIFFYEPDGSKTEKRFVLITDGDRIAKVHDRLQSACVRFDHWLESDGNSSSIRTHSGVTIESRSRHTKVVVTGVGKTEHTVFFTGGHCAWWDKTYGAAVLPIGVDRVERLIVVPGDHKKSEKSKAYPNSIAPRQLDELSVLSAYIDSLPKHAFVVELDTVGLLPSMFTGTDELVLLFVAYAYAGSMLGTRLMPRVAARSIHDDRAIPVPGSKSAAAHDAIRLVVRGAVCPLGCYSALALLPLESTPVPESVASDLRCERVDVQSVLLSRLTSCSVYDTDADLARRARFSFWVHYGEPERLVAHARAVEKESDPARTMELRMLQFHTDEWMTTLSATTGLFVREDQRARVALITRNDRAWSVVQMGMGFGKSSVIVPLLVARYLSTPHIKIVFVTQPPHLVPQAARTVGALIAAHPFVRTDSEKLVPVRTANAGDIRRFIDKHNRIWPSSRFFNPARIASRSYMPYKLVVVLSTADMQSLVRDNCSIYGASDFIAHIADEVDSESDPMRCEVIIEGPETIAHYHPEVAKNIDAYYDAACALGIRNEEESQKQRETAIAAIADKIEKLDKMCPPETVQAGTRLKAVFDSVRRNMVHRTHYGLSHVESKIPAVPFEYAGTPSTTKDFADYDVSFAATVQSINACERPCDLARLEQHITGKFGPRAPSILGLLAKVPSERRRYYLTHIAMPKMKASTTETAVSFVDSMGSSQTFIGFSGTMGTTIEAPVSYTDRSDSGAISYASPEDPRNNKRASYTAVLHDDQASNDLVKTLITSAEVLCVDPQPPGFNRAKAAIAKIAEHMKTHRHKVCIVDGNGEFGAFDSDLETLRETWPYLQHIGADGLVVRNEKQAEPRVVRYYSHRNSRGVDTEMPIDTVGYTTASDSKSLLSEIAQAVFRLRRLRAVGTAGQSQRVVLVVVSEDGRTVTGAKLFERLTANEEAHSASAAITKKKQMEHAAKLKKEGEKSFERSVVYADIVPDVRKQKISQKQQVQVSQAETTDQTQNEGHKDKTIRRQEAEQCYERTKPQSKGPEGPGGTTTAPLTLSNSATVTAISSSLVATNIALSPMITMRELTDPIMEIRRAFAVGRRGSLVVLTIVEAWARYSAEDSNGPYSYYTHDGALILGDGASAKPGTLLLGRFLCDDRLTIEEEIRLLVYLRDTYATKDKKESFQSVITCLVASEFISQKTHLLSGLLDKSSGAIISSLSAQDIANKMAEPDRDPALNKAFVLVFEEALKVLLKPKVLHKERRARFGRFI